MLTVADRGRGGKKIQNISDVIYERSLNYFYMKGKPKLHILCDL